MEKDGRTFIVDRLKELIKVNGLQVSKSCQREQKHLIYQGSPGRTGGSSPLSSIDQRCSCDRNTRHKS